MMDWQLNLTKKCSELNMEVVATMTGLTIFCPKMPNKKEKDKVLDIIPEKLRKVINFEEGLKPSTLYNFKNLIRATGVVSGLDATPSPDKSMKINLTGNGNPEAEKVDWSSITSVLKQDGYVESWELSFNGKTVEVYNRKITEELRKNSFREIIIQKDEITNLRILLETEMDFDKLLEQL